MPARLRKAALARIEALLRTGYSIRAVATAMDIHRETIRRYAKDLQPEKCTCGKPISHKGRCSARYLRSFVHKEVLAKVVADHVDPPRPSPRKLSNVKERYPYCVTHRPGRGNAMLTAVDSLVSRYITDDIRADICQDLLLYLLEGNLEIGDLTESIVGPTIRRRMNMFNERTTYRLDTLMTRGRDENDDSLRLIDVIPTDYEPILGKRSVNLRRQKRIGGSSGQHE